MTEMSPLLLLSRSIALTCVSMALPCPMPPTAVMTSNAWVATMSVAPSAASTTLPLWMTRSPVPVLRSLPTVTAPSASMVMAPAPALMTVSPLIASAPVPASNVMLAPTVDRSASSLRLRPAPALTKIAPALVTMAPSSVIDPPAPVLSDTAWVRPAVMSALTARLPPACTVTAASVLLSIWVIVSALSSRTLMAPPAVMSSVVASMVVPTPPRPSDTAPAASMVTLPALAMLPMVTAPPRETMRTVPALPVMAPMVMSFSATIRMSPPSIANVAMSRSGTSPIDNTPSSGLSAASGSSATCSSTRSLASASPTGVVRVMVADSTAVVSVRSSPAVTVRSPAVTRPPRVRPRPAVSTTVPPPPSAMSATVMSDTTTSASSADRRMVSPTWVGRLTTVRLPLVTVMP